ncbi:hypothetical protein GS429_08455 [Natronorubrum sp. JWXQ-INN-674]|uniref:Uncharacterized protein n=1 Tax=Natronorubrum halalkaliphilum TaxID=2691917 RepID=A0A6B0VJU3_9EURY|nr:hypothetical protein [Natronorubrum halalkaliphilum]MXV62091.1 hypothetical protein [Natronorubrum halalkaliphilum]
MSEGLHLDGDDIQKIEQAMEDAGFDATVVGDGPSDYVSSTSKPAAKVTLHVERDSDE